MFGEQSTREAGPYDRLIYKAADLASIEPELIAAVIASESAYDPDAVYTDIDGGTSHGLMQVRRDVGRRVLKDPYLDEATLKKPWINILAGTTILKRGFDKYDNLPDAVAAYNSGKARKNAAGQYVNSKGVPNVQAYVDRVLGYYAQYKAGAPFKPGLLQNKTLLAVGGLVLLFLVFR